MATSSETGNAAVAAVETAITGRRTVKEFDSRPVPRAMIARLVDLAVWAPNHRLTEPWRFYVFDGPARARLGEVARQVTLAQLTGVPGANPAIAERKAAEAAAAWANLPAIIYVTALRDPDPEIDLENYGATCCAILNLMLAAHVAGLATSWSSGAVAAAAALRQLAGASEQERMVGLIRLGYPDPAVPPRAGRRVPGASRLVWVAGDPPA